MRGQGAEPADAVAVRQGGRGAGGGGGEVRESEKEPNPFKLPDTALLRYLVLAAISPFVIESGGLLVGPNRGALYDWILDGVSLAVGAAFLLCAPLNLWIRLAVLVFYLPVMFIALFCFG